MDQITIISGWKQHQKYLQGFPFCLLKDVVHIVDRKVAIWEDNSCMLIDRKGDEPHKANTVMNECLALHCNIQLLLKWGSLAVVLENVVM